jgi:hypothetical protein
MAVGRAGIDVATADADGRRAEEPLPLRLFQGLDPPKLDLGCRVLLGDQLTQLRQQALVVRAAIEVKKLDPHAVISR